MTLEGFINTHLGGSFWSPCTGNEQAGIDPQCFDLAALWATNSRLSCFPRTGNAQDLLVTASDWEWEKHNGAEGLIPAGALIVYRTRSKNGHVAISRKISYPDVQYTLDQNWSKPNRVTLEDHRGLYVLGWMRGEWLAMATEREVEALFRKVFREESAYAIGAVQKGGNSRYGPEGSEAPYKIPGAPSLQKVAADVTAIREKLESVDS